MGIGICSYGTYDLINYFDVWGNAKDGWEVNNQCVECNDLNISDDATGKDIAEYLCSNGYLTTSDMRRIAVVSDGTGWEVCARKGMMPLFGLIPSAR